MVRRPWRHPRQPKILPLTPFLLYPLKPTNMLITMSPSTRHPKLGDTVPVLGKEVDVTFPVTETGSAKPSSDNTTEHIPVSSDTVEPTIQEPIRVVSVIRSPLYRLLGVRTRPISGMTTQTLSTSPAQLCRLSSTDLRTSIRKRVDVPLQWTNNAGSSKSTFVPPPPLP